MEQAVAKVTFDPPISGSNLVLLWHRVVDRDPAVEFIEICRHVGDIRVMTLGQTGPDRNLRLEPSREFPVIISDEMYTELLVVRFDWTFGSVPEPLCDLQKAQVVANKRMFDLQRAYQQALSEDWFAKVERGLTATDG